MNSLTLKIGEHLMTLQTDDQALFHQLINDYKGFIQPIVSRLPDLEVVIKTYEGVPTTDYQVDITSDSDMIFYQRSDYRIEVNQEYKRAALFALNGVAIKHALMNLYSAYIVHHSWGLLIHSSCLEDMGKAYLFTGKSGAGKSTVARLSAPRSVLSDEATILKIKDGGIQVFPSPFNSDLEISYTGQSLRLSAIYLLVQSKDVWVEPLRKSDAMMHLLDKVFYWSHDPAETTKVMHLCRGLIDLIPTYHLLFQKNDTFWELITC